MNKTISAHISGIVFNIEEQAFEVLHQYLQTIRGYFSESEGQEEILGDIEARIAELFSEKINERKNVINMLDVEEVINIMGQPEQYLNDDPAHAETPPSGNAYGTHRRNTHRQAQKNRRIFRDPDKKMLGGVCSGMAHYFGWDPLWIRLAFVAMFFIGAGVFLYILLWVIIPKAHTTVEKLEMKGQRVNVENIGKKWSEKIHEGIDHLENKLNDLDTNYHKERAKNIAKGFFETFSRIIGLGFIVAAIGMIIALFTLFMGTDVWVSFSESDVSSISYGELSDIIFSSESVADMAFIAILLLIGVPILYFLVAGIKLIFAIQGSIRGLSIIFSCLFIAGLVLGGFVGLDTGKQFNEEAEVTKTLSITQPATDTLYVDVMDDVYFSNDFQDHHEYFLELIEIEGEEVIRGDTYLDIVPGNTDRFEVVYRSSSRGPTQKEAIRRARNIRYNWQQQDSLMVFGPDYSFPLDDRFRDQHVQIEIRVPHGKAIHLSNRTDRIIYDIQNESHTSDHKMVGKVWTMTHNGLACIECNL